jgi:hypothetical protein
MRAARQFTRCHELTPSQFSLNRVQERIPLVTILFPSTVHRVAKTWTFVVFAALIMSTTLVSRTAQCGEAYYDSSTNGVESTASWPWWHGWYYRADGSPKYGRGFSSSTRDHNNRIPVNPPIAGPSFGYYQPCWRQIPLVRRCVSCETLQADREVPTSSGVSTLTPTPIPPAPESSTATEPEHTEPEAAEAPPSP